MDIRDIATQAAEEVVTSHTVGIIGETAAGPRTGIGTGSAIEWEGHKLILTAAHVLGKADTSELRFLFRPEGTIQRGDQACVHRKYLGHQWTLWWTVESRYLRNEQYGLTWNVSDSAGRQPYSSPVQCFSTDRAFYF